jgi:hypothetical protein
MKFHAYIREWHPDIRRNPDFFIGASAEKDWDDPLTDSVCPSDAVDQIVRFAFVAILNRYKSKLASDAGARCSVKRTWIVWSAGVRLSASVKLTHERRLGQHAFRRILSRKPTGYKKVLRSLARDMNHPKRRFLAKTLARTVHAESNKRILAIPI